jgi:hypothetical protein
LRPAADRGRAIDTTGTPAECDGRRESPENQRVFAAFPRRSGATRGRISVANEGKIRHHAPDFCEFSVIRETWRKNTMKRTLFRASILAVALSLIAGCATVEQLNEVRAIAEGAKSSADSAGQRADSALSTANQALEAANRAESTAQSAMDCCNQNTSRLDKMFEKAMKK